jgi:Holliday junction resolvase RusA-like endonuclease
VIRITVTGQPIPQGSLKAIPGGRVTRLVHSDAKLKPWRGKIAAACRQIDPVERFTSGEPVAVRVVFFLDRPKSVSPTKRPWPMAKPDLDKLLRGVLDGITEGGLWTDDAQVCHLAAEKRYIDSPAPRGWVEQVIAGTRRSMPAGALILVDTLDGSH